MLKINLKIYLDTSVISAYFDERQIDRLKLTRLAWNKIKKAKIFISEITLKELSNASDIQRQEEFKQFIKGFNVLPFNDQAKHLAQLYRKAKIIPSQFQDDIFQLAIATVFNMDYVLSWNFRHMVNVSVRAAINAVNIQQGYCSIDILAPAEML